MCGRGASAPCTCFSVILPPSRHGACLCRRTVIAQTEFAVSPRSSPNTGTRNAAQLTVVAQPISPKMAAKSGYERLTQVDEYDEPDDDERMHPLSASRSSIITKSVAILPQPTHVHRLPHASAGTADAPSTGAPKTRGRSNSGIDMKAINARLERYSVPHPHIYKVLTPPGGPTKSRANS